MQSDKLCLRQGHKSQKGENRTSKMVSSFKRSYFIVFFFFSVYDFAYSCTLRVNLIMKLLVFLILFKAFSSKFARGASETAYSADLNVHR